MTIQFKNTRYIADGSSGEIVAIAEWPIWNCDSRTWQGKTTLRNILLVAMHPAREFCIGEISPAETNATKLNPFKPETYSDAFFLDLASGSRNQGRFTFTGKTTLGKFYYGGEDKDQWRRIIYGSILHTGCKKLVYKVIRFIITDDENLDSSGNVQDDPTNNRNWNTGDSHAKASRDLMQLLGLPADPDGDNNYVDEGRPLQFRAALFQEWIGKGTLAYNPELDASPYDLAIPWSSLKGNKPPLGNYSEKLLFGLVFEAEQRRAKPGWMLLQWFPFEVLELDNIITKLMQKCQRLANAYNSITELADILRVDQSEAEAEIKQGSEEMQSEAEYVNNMIRVVQVDMNGVLLLHPYIVRRVKDRLRALWLNLAKAAGIRFFSIMTQPDESLAYYHTVLPNGSIQGQKVFCAPDFAEGEYIVFPNPMRHWGDCQLWENKHEGTYINSTGIMAVPTKLALTLGRDFDGDFVQLIKSSAYPNMRNAIADFSAPPATKKFPKIALKGNLRQIAINSMSDMTGIVANLLARARAGGVESQAILIPAGGRQTANEEMTVIDFLSQQVQIAVDSLKSAYPNNVNGLNAVKVFLDDVQASAPWLKDFKNDECFRVRKCIVTANSTDTISRLVQTVNSFWNAPVLADGTLRDYEFVLFADEQPNDFQIETALAQRLAYRQAMAIAKSWASANDGNTAMIREVSQSNKNSKESIFEKRGPDGKLYDPRSWVAAYWRVVHRAETGDAGLVFVIFCDEIISELKNLPTTNADVLSVYAVNYHPWADKLWDGQSVQVRGIVTVYKGRNYFSLQMRWNGAPSAGWQLLGHISDHYKPSFLPGQTKVMKIYAISFQNAKTKRVVLYDPSLTQAEIDESLMFNFTFTRFVR
jgi:hypothetical protein